jgi:DNA-binding transcriptional LysR family regulator
MSVLGPKLAEFARNYPDLLLDVSTDETRPDLVASGFDAGIQYGEFIQQDMVVVRVSHDHRPAIVGAPAYFANHPTPNSPHDLLQHRCVNYRHGSGEVYRWELDKGDQSLVVAVNGPLITNDIGLLTRAAIDGIGLAFMSEEQAAPQLARGALLRVLEDCCPPFPGFFPLLPEPTAAASRTDGAHRDAPTEGRPPRLAIVKISWLGGRDSNLDTVVQRAVIGSRSVLLRFV